jgi:hypothetical protein
MEGDRLRWRWITLALVVANLLFWLWGHEGLRSLGMGPDIVQEPARLKDQIQPDAMRVSPQPAVNDKIPDPAVTVLPPAEPLPAAKGN